jgi:hypothetical protein
MDSNRRVGITERFERAFVYAMHIHAHQRRKGTDIPYLAHLMAVSALVLEQRGDEDEAVGALLHDAGEDAGGEERLEDIALRFGDRVSRIVRSCTDTLEDPKPPWPERKAEYLRHLLDVVDKGALLVSLADKVHNAGAILSDYRSGIPVFSRFKATKEGTLWYYRKLADVFVEVLPGRLTDELVRLVAALETETGPNSGQALHVEEFGCLDSSRFGEMRLSQRRGDRVIYEAEASGLAFLITEIRSPGSEALTKVVVEAFADPGERKQFEAE